jgi:hypothetical protein
LVHGEAKVDEPTRYGLDLTKLPQNIAVYAGETVTFTCWVDEDTANPRIQWTEYAHSPNGGLISDGNSILPGHPQSERYSLNTSETRQFDLIIVNVGLADGGAYSCYDSNAPGTVKQRSAAQLIVIAEPQNCTTTMPANGFVMEGVYYTIECTIDYGGDITPYMRYDGPGPFSQSQTDTGSRVWSGMAFYAQRTMSSQHWDSRANFTDNFKPVPVDTADNVPTFENIYDTVRITVQWSPQGMYAEPVKPLNEYLVGDRLECFADAFPTASFQWHNLRTNERFNSSVFFIPQEWEGFDQTMRCAATNTINGLEFSNDHYLPVNVRPPPTTPTTTTPPTTTPVPAVSNCNDLTGRWMSTRPLPAAMCLEVNKENGTIHGVVRNDTDTFWVDLVGVADVNNYDHQTFTGIWPQNRAVSTFIGECSRCFGQEILLVSAISRSKGGPPCATPGEINYSQEYEFIRNPSLSCPPITIPTFGN